MPNKSVESNGRVVLSWSFHVVREFDLAAGWRFPPVPHLLRSAEIMKLTHENFRGSWIVAGSESEHVGPGDELFHFTPPDRFVTESKQPNGRWYSKKYRYELTEEGFKFGPRRDLRCAVTAWLESGFLILRPAHGKETWSIRLTDEENQAEQAGSSNGG